MKGPRVLAYAALAALVSCGGGSASSVPDGGAIDALADLPAPEPPDTPAETAPPDDVSPPDGTASDAPPRCRSDMDCAPPAPGRRCDTTTGRCVQCLPASDTCAPAQHCDPGTNTCVAGCRSDEGCAGEGRRCDTSAHACVECVTNAHCGPGRLCVGRACVAGCDGSHPCDGGRSCCAGACVDTLADVAHCGRCDARCAVPNGTPACRNGTCAVDACTAPYGDCDGSATNGCETDTRADTAHCGRCGNGCPARAGAAATCTLGACAFACAAGRADCDGMADNGCEVDLQGDAAHCGRCANRCDLPRARGQCVRGACAVAACEAGHGDCDGNATNGCETDTRTAVAHCGRCGMACPARSNAFPGCLAGACVASCVLGYADCNGRDDDGCETDTRTDAAHCGGCGRRCGGPHAMSRCERASCVVTGCGEGFGD